MKTYSERTDAVRKRMTEKRKTRRRVTACCLSLAVVVMALVLFMPYDKSLPDVSGYAENEYYNLILRLNELTYSPPEEDNLFGSLTDSLTNQLTGSLMAPGAAGDAPEQGTNEDAEKYVEVTDNQVEGVTEADIIKRSENFIYYLSGSHLDIYSIEGEASQLVGSREVCEFTFPENYKETGWGWSANNVEMYLSQDCATLTVVMDYYDETLGSCVLLVNLDVTDPADVKTASYVYLPGNIISTRLVEDQLLLTYNYRIDTADLDFDQPETFVPSYGVPGDMVVLPGADILCPDTAQTARYTVVCSLNSSTLEVEDCTALLGYSQELYVSQNAIYATHSYSKTSEKNEEGVYSVTAMTEITAISYADHSLKVLGTVALEGSLKDQYSMDQWEGTLRVVTTTSQQERKEYNNGTFAGVSVSGSLQNVNLYCVDLSNWTVAASVIGFAPEGEEATSVRFDGPNAYVCTARIITLSDPVYFFDLSDIENITWTDTGTIDGYSTSLIDLGEGYLMGIGYGDQLQLKIEVYEEVGDAVESAAIWQMDASFSEEYKSYFIDREKNLIGLGVRDYYNGYQYILLHFDGYELEEIARVNLSDGAYCEMVRAFMDDGYLYILAPNNSLTVKKVG